MRNHLVFGFGYEDMQIEEMAIEIKGTEKKSQKSYFDVLGLCCSSEAPFIENMLKPLDGVKEVTVIVPSRTVIVVHDSLLISQIQIVHVLNKARLEANIRVQGVSNHLKRWPSPYSMASGFLLLLSVLKYVYQPLQWFALGAVAVGIPPIVLKAIAAIRNLRLDINILMTVAVIGTIAMGDYEEAGTIVFLFTIAEWLEARASHKATAAMSALTNIKIRKAVVAETGETVDAESVKVNTIVAVKAGEDIPIDGIVVEGDCEVDEKTLTGESFPVPKHEGSTVWAGTTNLNGYVSVRTTALAEDCVVSKMAKLVEEAQNSKTSTQRFIDKCAKFYTPAILVISACVAAIPAVLRLHNLKFWFHLALVVLVSACPCALILSTPVATFCALAKAARSGLLIKGGDHLETLAKIKNTAFDKTGTITRGEFVVVDFKSLCSEIDLRTLIHWVASVESKSSHPMADAVIDYGRSHSIDPNPEMVKDFQNFPGEGICAKINGRDVYIGNKRIAQRAGSETVPSLNCDTNRGKTIGYVYCGSTAAGVFTLSDMCRSGAKEAIQKLKSMGIVTAMLTGDSHAAAMHAQEQLGNAIELVHAELLPEDKVKIITEFKKKGRTAMIGDGVNDAPALATADIGISMGVSGSALASETGNVILMSNDIRKIPKCIKLARKARRKIIENVILSITSKAAILGLAISGHPLVWAAVLADVGTCLVVILNSMLLLRTRHRHEAKCCKPSMTSHGHKIGCGTSSLTKDDQHVHQDCCSAKTTCKTSPKDCSSKDCVTKCQSSNSNSILSAKNHLSCGATDETNHVHPTQQHCCSAKFTEKTSQSNSSSQICKSKCQSNNSHPSLSETTHKIALGETSQINHDHVGSRHCHAAQTTHQAPSSICSSEKCATKCQPRSSNSSFSGETNCNHSGVNEGKCESGDEFQKLKHSHDGICNDTDMHKIHSHNKDDNCSSHLSKNSRAVEELDGESTYHSHSCNKTTQGRKDREPHSFPSKVINHSTSGACEPVHKHQCHSNLHGCETLPENLKAHDHIHGAEHTSTDIVSRNEHPKSDSPVHDACCLSDEERRKGHGCHHSLKECTENAVAHACMTFDKREARGCCKSYYMKECCRSHGQLGAGLGGGLSEIVIEQV